MGQSITILGRGLTNSTQVQFAAADDTGFAGVVTRTGTANAAGTALTIAVPPQARSGALSLVGAAGSARVLVAPVLRSSGGAITPGGRIVLEGTGLVAGELAIAIDGVAVDPATVSVHTTSILGEAQQLVDLTVPAGVSAGVITATTRGGSSRLRPALATLPDQTFSADPGDTLAAAAALNLPQDTTTAIVSTIGDGAYGSLDVDLYKFSGSAGDLITLGSQDSSPYPYLRLFDAAGDQLAAGNWYTTPSIADFRLPAAGTYYLGVSSAYNQAYDPTAGGSGGSAYYTGQYRLTVTRSDGLRTSIASISAVAASGTPARPGVASADVGQVITLHGTGFLAADQVAFTEADDAGNLSQVAVAPASVSADGTAITVAVPQGAVTGAVRLAREDGGLFLQVVPTLSAAAQNGAGSQFHGAYEHLTGTGFVQAGTVVSWGGTTQASPSSYPYPLDVYSSGTQLNDNSGVPQGAAYGPITVTTAGGTSAAFGVSLASVSATAASGTPAVASLASANPGQAITLHGSGFTSATDVIFAMADDSGNPYEYDQRPTAVSPDGTSLVVIVPTGAMTGAIDVVGDLNNARIPLQVVPILTAATLSGDSGYSAQVYLSGSGLVDGSNSVYTFGSYSVADDSGGSQAIDVYSSGTRVYLGDLRANQNIFGPITVTTAGGTSAPYQLGFLGITSTAATGTPANSSLPSANAGQVVTLNGTGLTTSTNVVYQYVDTNGNTQTLLMAPTTASSDGTSATLTLPSYADGAFAVHVFGAEPRAGPPDRAHADDPAGQRD